MLCLKGTTQHNTMKQDYYKTLGINKQASDSDIKKAYRKLAMKYHPDRNSDNAQAEGKFKQVKEAYEVLSDADKRTQYDQFGHDGIDFSVGGGQQGGFGDIFDDMFGDIFGGNHQRSQRGSHAQRGADLRYRLDLSLEEAVIGLDKEIRFPKSIKCKTCKGNGAKPGSSPVKCSTCQGQGQVRMQQGFFSIQQTCSDCNGQGSRFTEACSSCRGQGRVTENKKVAVKIPAGVDTGDRIRLANEGEQGANGGPDGDLFVEIHVSSHNIFERQGNNLHCEVPIDFVTAAIGGELEVPTLNGKVSLKIPSETQTNSKFRIRGKGVKALRSAAVGDLICQVAIETPVRLTSTQKDLLNKFKQSLDKDGNKHNPKAKSWFTGVKNFFEGLK